MRTKFSILTPAGKRSGVPFTLLGILLLFGLAVTAYLFKGVTPLHLSATNWMYDGEWYALYGVALLVGALFVAVFRRHIKVSINWFWLLLLLLLFAGNTVGLFLLPYHETGMGVTYQGQVFPYEVTFTVTQRVRYCLSYLLACGYLYLLFELFPKALPTYRKISYLYHGLVILGLLAIVISLIKDREAYASFFDPAVPIKPDAITSFTENPNTFAFLLNVASIALCHLQMRRHSFANYLILFVLGAAQVFIGSRTGIFVQGLLVVVFVILRFVRNLASHPAKAWTLFLLFLGLLTAGCVLLLANPFPEHSFLWEVSKKLTSDFLQKDRIPLSGRIGVYNHVIAILNENPLRWVFGVGDTQAIFYFGARTFPSFALTHDAGYAHSSFLQDLLTGGIIRLAFAIVLCARAFYKAFYLWGKKNPMGPFLLFVLLLFLTHGLMESTCLTNLDSRGIVIYLLAFLPIEAHYHFAKSEGLAAYKAESKGDLVSHFYDYESTPRIRTTAFMAPIAMAMAAFLSVLPIVSKMQGADLTYYGRMGVLAFATMGLLSISVYCLSTVVEAFARRLYSALICLLYLVLFLLGAIFGHNVGIVPAVAVVMALPCILLYVFRGRTLQKEGGFAILFKMLLPLIAPVIVCALFANLCFYAEIPMEEMSFQIPLCFGLGAVLVLAFLYSCKGYGRYLFPWPIKLLHLDTAIAAREIEAEAALEEKEKKHFTRIAPYVQPRPPRRYTIDL